MRAPNVRTRALELFVREAPSLVVPLEHLRRECADMPPRDESGVIDREVVDEYFSGAARML